MSRGELFPAIEPYASGLLAVDSRHSVYWEQCGNPRGVPVVFLHGGPGAGATVTHRRFFDPAFYRIVIFDQRGSGRSTPLAEIIDNSTAHLVADMEALRRHLKIDRWTVFGGSWGSTLGLAYAHAHPECCRALILRGIFLGRQSEVDWFMHGIRMIFPEAWRAFVAPIPEAERGDLLGAYYKRLIDPDPAVHMPVARAWSIYDCSCSTLLPNPEAVAAFCTDRLALSLGRITAHYFKHEVRGPDNDLLSGLERIRHLPTTIIQGRYDMVCPLAMADELAGAWPEAEYIIVPDAGHSAMEPGTYPQLLAATEKAKHQG